MLPSHLQGLEPALAVALIVLTIKAGKRLSFHFEESYFYFLQRGSPQPCSCFQGSIVSGSHEGGFN